MKKDNKKTKDLLKGALLTGLMLGAGSATEASDLLKFNDLGSGEEIRAQVMDNNQSFDAFATLEMKCGEGKCGEGKCGGKEEEKEKEKEKEKGKEEKKAKEGKAEKKKEAKKNKEGKSKEGKCGEGKCGAE